MAVWLTRGSGSTYCAQCCASDRGPRPFRASTRRLSARSERPWKCSESGTSVRAWPASPVTEVRRQAAERRTPPQAERALGSSTSPPGQSGTAHRKSMLAAMGSRSRRSTARTSTLLNTTRTCRPSSEAVASLSSPNWGTRQSSHPGLRWTCALGGLAGRAGTLALVLAAAADLSFALSFNRTRYCFPA